MSQETSFVERCLVGDFEADAIFDYIDRWHGGGSGRPLWAFLGMTRDEYGLWVEDADALPAILNAHRFGTTVEESLQVLSQAADTAAGAEARAVGRRLRQRERRPA